jgi:hypothetical protein
MGLKNPIGRAVREKYVYLEDPTAKKRIAELEALLEAERAMPPREVIKEVEKTALMDEGLLERLDVAQQELMKAHKELAVLRGEQRSARVMVKEIPKVEVKEVLKEREVIRIVRVKDWRLVAMVAGPALILGTLIGYIAL